MNIKKFLFLALLFPTPLFATTLDEAIRSYNAGNFHEAKDLISQVEQQENPRFFFHRGVIFHKLFKTEHLSDDAGTFFDEALKAYKKTLEFQDKRLQSYAQNNLNELYLFLMKRGQMHSKMKNFQDALLAFQRANKIKPDNVASLQNLAITYQRLGKTKQAAAINKKMQEQNVLVRCEQLKYALKKKQRVDKKAIKQLVAEHPYNVACLEILNLYLTQCKKNSREKILEELLAKEEDVKRYQRAVLWRLQKKWKESYETFHDLYKKSPDDKILIQLCDVGYEYSKKLILESNADLENDDKYDDAQDVIDATIALTEKLVKRYDKNLNALEHLYFLYTQKNLKDKAAAIKSMYSRLGGELPE